MNSVINKGLEGVQRGLANAARDAERASKAFNPGSENDGEFVEAATDLKQDVRQVQASAKVIRVGDELNRSVLDILA